MSLSQDKRPGKDHLYVLTVRLNADIPEQATAIEGLKTLIAQAEKQTPQGQDASKGVVIEAVERMMTGTETNHFGSPVDFMRRALMTRLDDMEGLIRSGFDQMADQLDAIEVVESGSGRVAYSENEKSGHMEIPDDLFDDILSDHNTTDYE